MVPRTLALLAERYREPPTARITEAELSASLERNLDAAALHDLALAIARAYQDNVVSYEAADDILNDLWSMFLDRLPEIWTPFYDIYCAFDAGEWHRRADATDDPVAEFTDPMIAEILLRHPCENTLDRLK